MNSIYRQPVSINDVTVRTHCDVAPAEPSRWSERLPLDLLNALDALACSLKIEPDTIFIAAWALVLDRVRGDARVSVARFDSALGGTGEWTCVLCDFSADNRIDHWLKLLDASRGATQPLRDGTTADTPIETAWLGRASLSLPSSLQAAILLRRSGAASEILELDCGLTPIDVVSARALLDALARALHTIAGAPQSMISAIDLLSPEDRRRQESQSQDAAWDYVGPLSVVGCFAIELRRDPTRTALLWDGGRHTYGALDGVSSRYALALEQSGVKAGDIVALALERSPQSIATMLAVLELGAAYLPIDPNYPSERIAFMLADARAKCLITVAHRSAQDWGDTPRLDLDALAACLPEGSVFKPAIDEPAPDALAYIMYTSGSTGTPKGVEIAHRSIVRLVKQARFMRLDESVRMLQAAPLGFDASTLEIWGPLLNGGCCVLHHEALPTGPGLARAIASHGVTSAWLTAGLFNAVVDDDPHHLRGLSELLVGGEALSVPHVRRALQALPDTTLINGYGPTECTTFSTTYRIPRALAADERSIPIGHPITETTAYILNARGELIPPGLVGELYIGGLGLARGYLGHPALSAERFVANPFGAQGDRLYRTGDRVRYRPAGEIEFVGRIDGQVKIRGFRIETAEIEARLAQHPAVQACAVIAREDKVRGLQLVAYLVTTEVSWTTHALRDHLAASLPEFMLPAAYVNLDRLPITVNGKLDRRALPAPVSGRDDDSRPYVEPQGALEHAVAAVFAAVLGIERVGRDDNFFELGGHSLLVLRTVARLRELGDPSLSIATLFSDPTPRGVAHVLAGSADAIDARRLIRPRPAQEDEPIAIVGMAGRFPGAPDVETFWDNLCQGREGIRFFAADELDPSVSAALRADPAYVRARGVLDDVDLFDPAFFGINPNEAALMDPQQRVFLEICWECLERAGHIPDECTAPVGVFAGMYNATYFQRHVSAHPEAIERVGEFQVMLANEKDYIATRAAHRLNLTGPAISVHTACSTSLVAIAQAVDSLRRGQCAMALAGGASITCPPNSGYLYQDGAMLSPDGHTRSFDASARGTVFSDGAAVVLLKRLSDALADGNPIHALIKGVAVNNDGGGKASFTAPSAEGQSAVIAAAHDAAGVEARSIGYIEAHGTATPLGDPVEIAGLVKAFRRSTQDNGFCAIGSVKSNIGHTVIAAGASGVIKVALALAHERIPPTLHFNKPNAQIDFAASPFVVNDTLMPWPRGEVVRRAGVSSFGVGGTNAHAVLEEAPVIARSAHSHGPSRGPYVLRLSARTLTALDSAAARLADHLQRDPSIDLANVEHTLHVGRKAFTHRLSVAADSVSDAVEALRGRNPARRRAHSIATCTPQVVFMFPGQGSQYTGMGARLYTALPEFREAFDECMDALAPVLDFDLKTCMFEGDAESLAVTARTQPATFSLEYALARFWMSQHVQPVALIGHSVGEFVAAVVAGVMPLADAARMVAERGKLMQALPAGAMLSVRLGREALIARLPETLSLAAVNAPNACVVAGPQAQVDAFAAALERDGVSARALQTSHAFHSAMMDAAVAPFEAAVRIATLAVPKIPIISTVTGEQMTALDATDPHYWARHLRETVQFSSALVQTAREAGRIFLEIGPRATLTTLARQHTANKPAVPVALASLADRPEAELIALAGATGELWTLGVDAARRDANERRQRIVLPTYPFERQRCWVPTRRADPNATFSTELDKTMTTPTAPLNRHPALLAKVRSLFEDTSGVELEDADPSALFLELGLDSLALTQVALQLKKHFSVDVSFRHLMERYRSFDALVEYLDAELPPEAAAPAAAAPAAAAVAFAQAALPALPIAACTDSSALQQLIQQQLQLMSQQLTALGLAQPAVAAATGAAPLPLAPIAAGPAALINPEPVASDDDSSAANAKYDVKKAFGAIARIHNTSAGELTRRQQARLDAFMRRYIERTRRSKDYTAEHRPHLADPRVVNGFRPQLKEIIYQIVIERSRGARMWDIDGNEYVDALNGFGMSLFGWQPPFVLEAVRRQLDDGYDIGPQHPLAGDVAKLVCELTGFDRAGLCNTGSEAVMGTIRIARTVTGRSTIVIFSGAYHGIFDEVIVRGTKKLRSVPAAPGILPNTAENVLVLDYGTPESLAIIKSRANEIAAVLVEPVQSRRPDFQPREFLCELRDITKSSGSLLIFDEVVTGFRAHPAGVQGLFGIRADLASYGKVLGGGFPIGVIAGRREFMDALDGGGWQYGDDSIPSVGVTYFAGTFVRHPLALAAAKAVLEHIKREGPGLQAALTNSTAAMVDELNAFCRETGAPIVLRSFASVWKIIFSEDHPLQDLLFAMMRSRGVHILDNFPCFFTTAHTANEIALIKTAFKESVAELQEAEFIPKRSGIGAVAVDASRPPVPGARLGRDAEGKSAWFVSNPDAPGKYLKVGE